MELVKYPKNTEPGKDGLHLQGEANQDTETLCGVFMDSGEAVPEFVDGDKPECINCIKIAKNLFKKYKKKQVTSW